MRPVAPGVHPVNWHVLWFMLLQWGSAGAGEQHWLRRGGCCFRLPGLLLEAASPRQAGCKSARRPVVCLELPATSDGGGLRNAHRGPGQGRTGRDHGPRDPCCTERQYNDFDVICTGGILLPRGRARAAW